MKHFFTLSLLFLFTFASNAGEWTLIWSDEFNYSGVPDPAKWRYEEGLVRNKEKQLYTKRIKNCRVVDGCLVISAHHELIKNPAAKKGSDNWKHAATANYTSASIQTHKSFLYGKVEVRAKIPTGKGSWPAIWMLGKGARKPGGYPRCGEIDILENIGKKPRTIYATIHYLKPGSLYKDRRGMDRRGGKLENETPYDGFHIYTMEWNEQEIKISYDDREYLRFKIDNAGKGSDNPFRKPQFLLLNLALGGGWAGPVIDDAIFPLEYRIDYVRIFRHK